MKTTNLEHLMQRYITGQVTEEEKRKIEAWLDLKKTEEGTDMVLDAEDEERLFRKITASVDNIEEVKAFRPATGNVRSLFSRRWLQVAATLFLLMVASYGVWVVSNSQRIHETITHDATEKVILEDGTIVWLGQQSRLTYVNKEGTRQATLEGAGLFEVAKDPERPFSILCGHASVTVVGTSFHLNSGAEGVDLKVLTGKVRFAASDTEVIEVNADEMAVYRPAAAIVKAKLDEVEREAVTAPTEYDMQFRNTALEEVIARIEKKFDTDVVLEDARAGGCRITADFTDHSLESTLEMISEFLEVEYIIRKHSVTLTGAGCP